MAYFTKLNNNVVERVESVSNNVLLEEQLDENNNVIYVGVEQESKGVEFLKTLYKEPNAVWKQTSYNTSGGVHKLGGTPLRKNYASIGYTYDEDRDAFIAPKPYNSWIFNENTCLWEAPSAMPDDDNNYTWNESTTTWDIVEYIVV
jgi:hypothetical protein|tara:strand:- start:125 stop:562 length:438 start_codon:yes stop_codon:yes gene_type:complete